MCSNFFKNSCKFVSKFIWIRFKVQANSLQNACNVVSKYRRVHYKIHANEFQNANEFITKCTRISFQKSHEFVSNSLVFRFKTHANTFQNTNEFVSKSVTHLNTRRPRATAPIALFVSCHHAPRAVCTDTARRATFHWCVRLPYRYHWPRQTQAVPVASVATWARHTVGNIPEIMVFLILINRLFDTVIILHALQ